MGLKDISWASGNSAYCGGHFEWMCGALKVGTRREEDLK